MKWYCPHDGAELGMQSSPSTLGMLRQCPTCAKKWKLDGNPIPISENHRFKAVRR